MKEYYAILLFTTIVLIQIQQYTPIDNSQYFTMISSITINHGFSTEKNSIATEKCYAPDSSTENNNQREISLTSESIYHSQLLTILNIPQDAFYYISNGLLYRYLREIEDNEFSISFNYIHLFTSEVHVKHSFDTFINQRGFEIYNKESTKDFRLRCGDRLIDKYIIGTGIIFTIKIEFETIKNKQDYIQIFNSNDRMQKQPITNFLLYLNKQINDWNSNNIRGSIIMHFIQFGGKNYPSKHVNKFNFKAQTCIFDYLFECQTAVNKIFSFLHSTFLLQFTKDSNGYFSYEYFVPLSILSFGKSIDEYGIALIESSSSLTNEITYNRQRVLELFTKHWSLYKYFVHLSDYYYVPFDGMHNIKVHLLMLINAVLDEERGLKCYTDLPNCLKETDILFDYLPKTIDDELSSFHQRFTNERLYQIEFKDNLCLEHGLEWEGRSNVEVYLFQNEEFIERAYLRKGDGFISCKNIQFDLKKKEITFNCYDKLLWFNLRIIYMEEKGNYLQCKDDNDPNEKVKEYEIKFVTRHNDYSYLNE